MTNKTPLKILHFLSTAMVGGTETSVFKLVRYCDTNVLKQDVAALWSPGTMTERFERIGVQMKHFCWDKRKDRISALGEMRSFVADGHYDLVIVYGLRPNIILRLLQTGTGTPVAGGLRSITSGTRNSFTYDWADRLTFPLCRGYISNSQMAIDRYVSIGFPAKKFFLCYNGVDTGLFRPDSETRESVRAELGLNMTDRVMITVARLSEEKNHELMLRAMKIATERISDIVLLICGDGACRADLERAASQLGISEKIHFLGLREDVPRLLAVSDVFLLSSDWEGIPNAVMEAMAAGLPVISTDLPGVHEIVNEGAEGLFVPHGDAAAMAERISALFSDPALLKGMGTKARERAEKQFSVGGMTVQFEKCCRSIIGGAQGI